MRNDESATQLVFVRGGGTASERFTGEGTAAVANLAAIMRDRTVVLPQAIYLPATAPESFFTPFTEKK